MLARHFVGTKRMRWTKLLPTFRDCNEEGEASGYSADAIRRCAQEATERTTSAKDTQKEKARFKQARQVADEIKPLVVRESSDT